ncbi:bola-like protein-domain-containing protein [Parasitella parasitica]|nr:bola-like protein-domain-containing protein [Parasitella parasitica]
MSLLSKIYTLQPAFSRTLVRSHSTKSTQFLNDFMDSKEKGPIQLSIENKINEALQPTIFEAVNESHLHAHHAAMKGNTNKETHFRLTIVSEEFKGKTLMQRHRLVYGLVDDELKNQGLHALTLKTKIQAEL